MGDNILQYIKNLEKRLDETNGQLKKIENALKTELKTGTISPLQNGVFDIGSIDRFIKNLYLSGKIIYPDVLDFGINNDFCINRMGKVGFHTNKNMDGVSIKGLPSFLIQDALYIGEMMFIIKISGAIDNYLSIQDVAIIETNHFQIIEINGDKIIVYPLTKTDIQLEPNKKYNITIYNTILGICDAHNNNILKINANGTLFYNTIQKKADININGTVNFEQPVNFKSIEIENNRLIPNLNAEYIGGKKAPIDGEIVGTKDKQQIWNKSFGNDTTFGMNRIKDINDPITDTDAVNKRYVDKYLSGIRVSIPVSSSIIVNDGIYNKSQISVEASIFNEGVRYILMSQNNPIENGIYVGISNKIIKRADDFCNTKTADDLRLYYTFIEELNIGVCFDYIDDFEWDKSPIHFNQFSKTESYDAGSGIKKENNKFSLIANQDIFKIEDSGLQIKDGAIDNRHIRNNYINIVGESGIDINKSVIKLGENAKIGIKIDRKQFHFGKNGELQLSSNGETGKIELEDTISAIGSLQNVHKLSPPKSIRVEFQYSEDYFDKNTGELCIQYYICCLNSDGKSTNYRKSDEYQYSDDVGSVFANIEWDIIDNCDGYILYRRINRRFHYVKMGKIDTNILDILVPIHYTKINWIECNEPDNINNTVFIVNNISPGTSYFVGGSNGGCIGIGTMKPVGALHVVANDINSKESVILLEGGDNNREIIKMVRRGIKGGAKIVGETADGKSSIEMSRNIRVVVEDEGVIFLGRRDDMDDINYKMGSDSFSVQAGDGGIYASGDMMCGGAFSTFNNRIGNHGAVLKTGCIGNSIGDEVSFLWEGDGLFAIPLNNGAPSIKKRVGVKNFTIQHPIHEDKYLVHACLEGPTADVFYRGVGRIEYGDESTDIELPKYFSKIVEKESYTIHITPRGKPIGILGGDIIDGNILRICTDKIYGIDLEFYWQVIGKRVGTDFESEPRKGDVVVQGFGPYTYLI